MIMMPSKKKRRVRSDVSIHGGEGSWLPTLERRLAGSSLLSEPILNAGARGGGGAERARGQYCTHTYVPKAGCPRAGLHEAAHKPVNCVEHWGHGLTFQHGIEIWEGLSD